MRIAARVVDAAILTVGIIVGLGAMLAVVIYWALVDVLGLDE